MTDPAGQRKHVRQVIVHATEEYLAISAFLAAFFLALTTYRTVLLAEYQIPYVRYGYAVVEALILGKVILIGEVIGVGRRFQDLPLMVSTLGKTFSFSLLVALFSMLEHLVEALVHREPLAKAFPALAGRPGADILANVIVTLVAFIPLFAFREIGRVLGEGKLHALFFRRRPPSGAGSGVGSLYGDRPVAHDEKSG